MTTSLHPQALWQHSLDTLPLVAILRGVQPQEVVDIGQALVEATARDVRSPQHVTMRKATGEKPLE